MSPESLFLSIPQFAKMANVSTVTVFRHLDKTIPSVTIGGRRMIPRSYLDELVAKANTASSAGGR